MQRPPTPPSQDAAVASSRDVDVADRSPRVFGEANVCSLLVCHAVLCHTASGGKLVEASYPVNVCCERGRDNQVGTESAIPAIRLSWLALLHGRPFATSCLSCPKVLPVIRYFVSGHNVEAELSARRHARRELCRQN